MPDWPPPLQLFRDVFTYDQFAGTLKKLNRRIIMSAEATLRIGIHRRKVALTRVCWYLATSQWPTRRVMRIDTSRGYELINLRLSASGWAATVERPLTASQQLSGSPVWPPDLLLMPEVFAYTDGLLFRNGKLCKKQVIPIACHYVSRAVVVRFSETGGWTGSREGIPRQRLLTHDVFPQTYIRSSMFDPMTCKEDVDAHNFEACGTSGTRYAVHVCAR